MRFRKQKSAPFLAVLAPGHQVEQAFHWQGKSYYRFANEFNLPFERMQVALSLLEEQHLKMDADYLQAAIEAMKQQLEKNQLSEVWRWVHGIEERLQWPFDADLVYKLAAVVFFDESENPYAYDAQYAKQKVADWRTADKEAERLRDFFYKMGLSDYLGPLKEADIDLSSYTLAQRKVKLSQITRLCTQLYEKAKTEDWYNSLKQEGSDLKALLN